MAWGISENTAGFEAWDSDLVPISQAVHYATNFSSQDLPYSNLRLNVLWGN